MFFCLQMTHSGPNCTIQECLEQSLGTECDQDNSIFDMKDSDFSHKCLSPNTKRGTLIKDIPQGDDNVIILHLADRCTSYDEVPLSIEQLASPQQSNILTHLVKDADNKGYKVYGILDGYITRTGGGQYPDASSGDT